MKAIVSVHGCCKRRVFTTEGTEITEAKAHVMSVTHLWVFHCGSVLAREFVSSLFLALRVQARSHSASQKNGAVRYGASLQKALLVDCEGVFRGGTTAPTGEGLAEGKGIVGAGNTALSLFCFVFHPALGVIDIWWEIQLAELPAHWQSGNARVGFGLGQASFASKLPQCFAEKRGCFRLRGRIARRGG